MSISSAPTERLRANASHYLMEAALLGLFMLSACGFCVLVEHDSSPVRHAVDSALARRAILGAAMGATAVTLSLSPWGRRSGAHLNPAFTLALLRLGRVHPLDAAAYAIAQLLGGALGVGVAAVLLGGMLADPAVNYVVTVPGPLGAAPAFAAELGIATVTMAAVLIVSGSRFARATPLVVGLLLALYITLEAPLSGMSLNPARTLASAIFAGDYRSVWVYLSAPVIGMWLPAELWRRGRAEGLARAE
ncbi:MAG: aquaporin [Myxococcales bacterium]|nr:aquaporin [Myxococcales bacterium]